MSVSLNGRLVTDLRENEVEVFEDGVPQQIDTFEHVQIPPGGPQALRVEPNSIRGSQQMATDPRARVFVLFIDGYHMDVQVPQQMRNPVRRFMEEALGPDDLIAVMMPEMATTSLTFTRRTDVLTGILSDTGEWLRRDAVEVPPDERERMYVECYGPEFAAEMIARRREKLTLDSLEELVGHLGALREERKAVLVVTKGWRMFEESPQLQNSPFGGIPPVTVDGLRGGRGARGTGLLTSGAVAQCEADRSALAHLNHRDRMREITGLANRSNVSFYPLSPLRIQSTLASIGTLRQMAEETDGLAVVNTNNIGEPMQRIIADTSSYYLLGYQSTNSNLDGRFRRITVQVKRPGVEVRARRGYRAVSIGEVRAGARLSASPRPGVEDAIAEAVNGMAAVTTPVPMRIRVSSWAEDDGAGRVWIVGELDERTRQDPAWRAGGRGDVTLVAGDGSPAGSQPVEMTKGQATFRLSAPRTGSLAPGEYSVRVRLRAVGTGGEPIADSVRVTVPSAASPLGEPLLFRRGPATGVRYVETADPRFRRNERLRLELPTAAADPAEARLLDRAGAALPVPAAVTTRDDASGAFRWLVVDAALAPFAAGDYVVEVTQGSARQVVAFRIVP
jgi:VWFA-related protein